ncbi:hypothetical protein Q8A73_012858 [Channa argus]|nr:hypothetical protein Q8A73_012858 [Channa argus]
MFDEDSELMHELRRAPTRTSLDATVITAASVALHAVASNLKTNLASACKGDGTESFTSWSRRFEVAVQAMTSPDADLSTVFASILPTRLTDAAFLRKIHEMGAENLDDALRIASRCERAGAALHLASTGSSHPPPSEQVAMTRPKPLEEKLLQAVEQLTLTVTSLRNEVQQLHEKPSSLPAPMQDNTAPSVNIFSTWKKSSPDFSLVA